ncbi:MAG TPA: hypothetical protein ENG87_00700 [Candidatus Pacearchaeota archaeon]|nr:hypothetical protein BMS3Abin17_00209 [archaeon BMS3Abin17]HDK41868.1 hypothetical protein [Candidatus Pacearchaeota archaeon]HDZ61506.1 hypothetical protein [Candidatus Pacearchaeota archaeon]
METKELFKIIIGFLFVLFGILDPYKDALLINSFLVIAGIFIILLGFKKRIRKYLYPVKKGFLDNIWHIFRG